MDIVILRAICFATSVLYVLQGSKHTCLNCYNPNELMYDLYFLGYHLHNKLSSDRFLPFFLHEYIYVMPNYRVYKNTFLISAAHHHFFILL